MSNQPERGKAVHVLIARCQEAIGELCDRVGDLATALEDGLNVSKPDPPRTEQTAKEAEPPCAHAGRLSAILDRILQCDTRVRDIIQRLEV